MELAEVNVAHPRASLDSPVMAGFMKVLDDVNWLADRSPGFVWRHRADDQPVTLALVGDDEVIVTLSTWRSLDALQQYVYRSAHGLFMRRGRQSWFHPARGFTTALWWVSEGQQPSVEEGLSRLEHLRGHGPTAHAFSLARPFPPPA